MTEKHFNGLTPSEAERLAMLAEECSEVIHVVMKILRHGYVSSHPDSPDITNRERLTNELSDVLSIIAMMDDDFDIIDALDHEVNFEKKLLYTHHQEFINENS